MTNPITLREYRESLGLSQAEAGARLGVTGVTWGQWETGRRWPPHGQTLVRLHQEFGVQFVIEDDTILVLAGEPAGE